MMPNLFFLVICSSSMKTAASMPTTKNVLFIVASVSKVVCRESTVVPLLAAPGSASSQSLPPRSARYAKKIKEDNPPFNPCLNSSAREIRVKHHSRTDE